jgi:tetratricopeptide (TPR) repeat protein
MQEGIEETKRGIAIDPTNLILNSELAFAYYLARQPEAAVEQARKTLELDPAYSYASVLMAWALDVKPSFQEALAELNRARAVSDPPDWYWIIAEIGYIQGRLGNRTEAGRIVDDLKSRTGSDYVDPSFIAFIYIAVGENDQAFLWLNKAVDERSGTIGWIKVDPHFDGIRSDPRFADLVRRMGL